MGVITDKTGLEIVGKIGNLNVDTSGLVKDATAQETNNAIDALKSAVQGLGTALGSDKANISGDNIANPSEFRQNIGISIGALASANTKVSVISGYFLRIANIIFVDAIFTANQSIGANEYLLSGQPSIGNNNYPLICALAEGGANNNNLARLYASYIVANGTLTAGKSYHCFGSYII